MNTGRSQSYFLNLDKVLPRPDYTGGNKCPKCGARLVREGFDLFCLPCGYRISDYFGKSADMDDGTLKQLMYNTLRGLGKH